MTGIPSGPKILESPQQLFLRRSWRWSGHDSQTGSLKVGMDAKRVAYAVDPVVGTGTAPTAVAGPL